MRDLFYGTIAVLVVFALLLVAVGGLGVGLEVVFEKKQCETFKDLHGDKYQFQWVFWGGCLVKTPEGRWIDADHYLQIEGITP